VVGKKPIKVVTVKCIGLIIIKNVLVFLNLPKYILLLAILQAIKMIISQNYNGIYPVVVAT